MRYDKVKKHRPTYFHIMREVPFGNKDLTGNLACNICHLHNSGLWLPWWFRQ